MKIAKLMTLVPGLTIRQVHYWGEQGWFGPEAQGTGSGNHIEYTNYDVELATIAMVLIKKLGMRPQNALNVAKRTMKLNDSALRLELQPGYFVTFEIPFTEDNTNE